MAEIAESVGGVSVLRNMATGASWTMIYAPGAGSNLRDGFGTRARGGVARQWRLARQVSVPLSGGGPAPPGLSAAPSLHLAERARIVDGEWRPRGDRRQVARRTHSLDARVGGTQPPMPLRCSPTRCTRPSAPIRREPNTCRVSLAQRCSVQARGICSPRRTNWRRRRRSFPERMCTCWMLPTTDSRRSSRAEERGSTYGTRPPQRCSIGSPASQRSRRRETARRSCGRRCLAAASSPP